MSITKLNLNSLDDGVEVDQAKIIGLSWISAIFSEMIYKKYPYYWVKFAIPYVGIGGILYLVRAHPQESKIGHILFVIGSYTFFRGLHKLYMN